MERRIPPPAIALVILGCGSTAKEPEVASAPADSAMTAASAEAPAEAASASSEAPPAEASLDSLPDKCGDGNAEGICAPPRAFVKKLCGRYPQPDIALRMFAKDSPWTRVYLNRNMEAWYTSGQQSTNSKLLFDEEVIVLVHVKANSSGMVIGSGATNYDVLRLDGVCASVEPEAISVKRPPAPKHASVPWQRLERNVRDALGADPAIAKADQLRRKECKGPTSFGALSPACAKADDKLSQAVADYITRGGQTPMPAK
jgi:hypothetical protein